MRARVLIVGVLFLAAACVSRADTFTLTDGRVLVGTVVRTEGGTIWVDTAVAGIRATIPIERRRIQSHEVNSLTAFDGLRAHASDRPTRQERAVGGGDYAVIPITGVIGRDSLAAGVDEALRAMLKNGIETIVFEIDTPGGSVAEAHAIQEAILRHEGRARFIALVRNAVSAGIWPAFACDELYFSPSGAIGGAVTFTVDHSTGSAEVDAKQNGILAAKVAGVAERKGHPACVVRAMTEQSAELYLCRDGDGTTFVAPQREEGATVVQTLDTRDAVLTLTATDAERAGLGVIHGGSAAELGEVLGLGYNRGASQRAEAIRHRHATALQEAQQNAIDEAKRIADYRKELVDMIPALKEVIERATYEAELLDPSRRSYRTDYRTGWLTPDAREQWQRDTDAAIEAWMRLGEAGVALRKALKDAQELKVDASGVHEVEAIRAIDLANRRIAALRENRDRRR